MKLKQGSKAGIVCCSNGLSQEKKEQYGKLLETLQKLGITPVSSPCIFEQKNDVRSGTAEERAEALMHFYKERNVDTVFDISGGDVSIEILPYLDFDVIADSDIELWGYSDLTPILNAIYTKTRKASCLYQVRNLVWECGDIQIRRMQEELGGGGELCRISYEWKQGRRMEGVVVGGNVRCLLKLAGTPFWPEMKGSILFLEALSGGVPQLVSFFSQLRILGVFEQVNGILLGTFTEMERKALTPQPAEILMEMVPRDLPVAVTKDVGHGADARALWIGRKRILE